MEVITFDDEIEEFIKSVNAGTRAKIVKIIRLLRAHGHILSMPYSKKIGNRLFELRIQGSYKVRIFYTYHNNNAVLLHGFVKKTMKIPYRELEAAKNKLNLLA